MPVHHHSPLPGNPDASLSFASRAPDSVAGAGHGPSAPWVCLDSAGRPGVAPHIWLGPGTERCSSAGPDHSAGTPAPRRGTARTSTSVRSRAAPQALALPLEPRMRAMASAQTLDAIERWCNNLRTLVADTVGRASRQSLCPVIAAVAPVLLNNSAVLPLVRLHANHPAMPGSAVPLNLLLNGCSASASASGRRLQAGERWASHEPRRGCP